MQMDIIASFKTDQRLLDAIHAAPEKRSPHELFEQKVSFVYGLIDRKSTLTKPQVRDLILQQAGEPASTK
jgi:hypothetical protein